MTRRLTHALVALAVALAACTPGERVTASGIVATVGRGAADACTFVEQFDGALACGPEAGAVSAVAQLVAGILASLPAARRGAARSAPPSALAYRYAGTPVTVILPAQYDAQAVLNALPRGGA